MFTLVGLAYDLTVVGYGNTYVVIGVSIFRTADLIGNSKVGCGAGHSGVRGDCGFVWCES